MTIRSAQRRPWTQRELTIIELFAWLVHGSVSRTAREIQASNLPDRTLRAITGKILEYRKKKDHVSSQAQEPSSTS